MNNNKSNNVMLFGALFRSKCDAANGLGPAKQLISGGRARRQSTPMVMKGPLQWTQTV